MRYPRAIGGAILTLTGLAAGLLAGCAATAWVLRVTRRPRSVAPDPSGPLVAEADSVPGTTPRRAGPARPGSRPPVGTPILGGPIIDRPTPWPKARLVRLAAAFAAVAVLATAAGLIGSARATASQNKKIAAAMTGGDPDRGRAAIDAYGCSSCHTIPGVRGATARVGPPLNQIGDRSYVAGVLANTPENMIRWIEDPPAVDPKTAMPNLGVTDADARDIAAYLYTLR